MQLLAETLHEVYPASEFLDVVVYSTGVPRRRNLMKMLLRLVWPNIVMDKERSISIQESIVCFVPPADVELPLIKAGRSRHLLSILIAVFSRCRPMATCECLGVGDRPFLMIGRPKGWQGYLVNSRLGHRSLRSSRAFGDQVKKTPWVAPAHMEKRPRANGDVDARLHASTH